MSECIHCGERDGMHWHGCATRTDESVCPCALCREPASADGPIDIDALGAEIDAADGRLDLWPGTWAKWIRDWPESAAQVHTGQFGLLQYLVPFADRISAAGKQVLAGGFKRDLRSQTERERARIVAIIQAFGEQYPLDLFSPPDPARHPPWPQYNAPDQYSAAMARHVVAVLLKQIAEDEEGAQSK